MTEELQLRLALALTNGLIVLVKVGTGRHEMIYELGVHREEPGPVGYIANTNGEFVALDALDPEDVIVCGPVLPNWLTADTVHVERNPHWKPE